MSSADQESLPLPLDVACPHCGAAVGWPCRRRTSAGYAAVHLVRWKAVGVEAPDGADILRNRRDELKRAAERPRPSIRGLQLPD